MPDLFKSSEVFDEWFSGAGKPSDQKEEQDNKNLEMIQKLHKILKPFMLRRTKKEVESTLPPKK